MAYATLQVANQRLAWMDYSGHEIAAIPLAPGPWDFGELSPDDRRVVLTRTEPEEGGVDLWIADLDRGVATRFTDEIGTHNSPAWSPDGRKIAYAFTPGSSAQVIKVKSVEGDTLDTFLASDPMFKRFAGWTPDGRALIYARQDPATQWDLWVLPLDGDHTPRPYLRTRFSETDAGVSHDGHWIAYLSDESGQNEGYVQSFPTPGGKYQVTTGGAAALQWSADGKHIYFGLVSSQNTGYVADVLPGPEFRLGPPRAAIRIPQNVRGVQIAHDGKRLLAAIQAGKDPTPSITVVLNGLVAAERR
jgi:serine/threonine-protein kinase